MQISEQMHRYQSNISAKEASEGTGVSLQRNQSVASLETGNVFEGTVGKIHGDQIQLLLSNGQSVNARLGGDVALFPGQAMFFEVAGKDGNTVSIRPYQLGETAGNPTIRNALDAAGLKFTPENVKMVDDLMQQQLPIDKASLHSFARLIADHPDIDQTTLIEMKKLDIPLTREMASQFENYKTDSYQIQNKMDEVLNQVTEAFAGEDISGEEAVKLNDKLLSILGNENGTAAEGELQRNNAPDGIAAPEAEAVPGKAAGGEPVQAVIKETPDLQESAGLKNDAVLQGQAGTEGNAAPDGAALPEQAALQGKETQQGKDVLPEQAAMKENAAAEQTASQEKTAAPTGDAILRKESVETGKNLQIQDPVVSEKPVQENGSAVRDLPQKLSAFLDQEEIKKLEHDLKPLGQKLDTDQSAGEFAKQLNELLKTLDRPEEKAVKHLLSGKEYLKILREMTKEQWSVRPEQFSGDKVKTLYENLDRQMKQTETVLREMGMKDTELARSVSDLKENLEFMNEINHHYTYLQVPIRFANQNANGDLYVYTNKKNLQDRDGELSAFLHFDMDHLGSTDISVLMKDRDVSTKFYLEDDTSYDLILKHADELQNRLKKKGYHCEIEAVNEDKKVNFVDDFLNAGKSSAGLVHRYSFDMKA